MIHTEIKHVLEWNKTITVFFFKPASIHDLKVTSLQHELPKTLHNIYWKNSAQVSQVKKDSAATSAAHLPLLQFWIRLQLYASAWSLLNSNVQWHEPTKLLKKYI